MVAGGAKQLNWRGRSSVPHGAGHNEGRKKHRRDSRGQYGFDVAHAQGLVEPFGRAGGDVEDAGDDADDSSCDVVGDDPAWIEGVEALRAPGGLNRLQVT